VDLRVWVSKPGYVPLHAMWAKQFQSDGDQIPAEFRFEMKTGTKIGGVVHDEKGRAIAGAKVEIYNASAIPLSVLKAFPTPGIRPVPVIWLAEDDSAIITDAKGQWLASNIPDDEDLARAKAADVRRIRKDMLRLPLRLRVSHPDYATFDASQNANFPGSPNIAELRSQQATVVLKPKDDSSGSIESNSSSAPATDQPVGSSSASAVTKTGEAQVINLADEASDIEIDAKRILERAAAVRSGHFVYHLDATIAKKTVHDTDFDFCFEGDDWAIRYPASMGFDICHDGRLLELRTHTQPDGRIDKTLTIRVAKPTSSLFDHGPYPPHFAGTIWHQSTRKFLQENASSGRAAGKENVNGRDCSVLEWDVAGKEWPAFGPSNDMMREGGRIRVCYAAELGYALPKVQIVDRFGTAQVTFSSSEFRQVATSIYMPRSIEIDAGGYYRRYTIKKADCINEQLPERSFTPVIPTGTEVWDGRPHEGDNIAQGQIERYPFRHFTTGAEYPNGFPDALLAEMDRGRTVE
jgi:hypothetical protein